MRQPMGNGETTGAFQLSQYYYDLSEMTAGECIVTDKGLYSLDVYLCSGGTASTVQSSPRVETTL